MFYEKELQKTNQKEFRVEKVIKVIVYMTNGKVTIILLKVGLIKKISLHKMSHFPEPYTRIKKQNESLIRLIQFCNKMWHKKPNRCWYIRICYRGWFS